MLTKFKEEDIKKIENIKGVVKYHDCPITNVEYIGLEDSDKKFKSNMIFYYPSFMLSNIKLVSGRSLNDSDKGKVLIAYDFIKAFGYQNGEELIGKKIILHIKQNLNKDTAGLTIMPTLDETQEVVSKDFEFEIAGITEKTMLSSIIFVSLVDAVDMVKFSRNTEEVLTDKDNQRFFGFVEIDDAKNAEYIMDEIKNMGFSGQTYEQSKNILGMIFDILTIIFSSFGILAMAVSSLGIVNTLIMAVYERTREIGVMKALGANRFTIIKLFTVEAGLIGTIAGLLGLIIGFGISELLNYIGHKTIFSSFETLDISNITFLILLAPIISIVVSILAGIYPALKASKLNPVDALKYE
jgi:putative ABC transport system permease protein